MHRLFKSICGLSPFLGTLRIDNGNGDANTAKETGTEITRLGVENVASYK